MPRTLRRLTAACALASALAAVAPAAAPAAPTIRTAGAAGTTGSGTSASIAMPAGTVAGDLMIAAVNANGTGTISTPAGWTRIGDDVSGSRLDTFYRVMQTGDTGPWTASLGSSRAYSVNAVAYTGVDQGTPIDVSTTVNAAAAGPLTAPAATSTLPWEAVLFAFGFKASSSTSLSPAPAGSTMASSAGPSTVPSGLISLDAVVQNPGAVTVKAANTTGAHTSGVAQTIVIRENPALTASFPAGSYAWGSWAIGTSTTAEQTVSVTSDRPWGVKVSADRADGRMTEFNGSTYLSRALASPLQWGLTSLGGASQTPTWTALSGTGAAVASGQAAKSTAVDVGVTFRQQVSYADDAALGGNQYRIVITYNAGQGF